MIYISPGRTWMYTYSLEQPEADPWVYIPSPKLNEAYLELDKLTNKSR